MGFKSASLLTTRLITYLLSPMNLHVIQIRVNIWGLGEPMSFTRSLELTRLKGQKSNMSRG